MRGSFIEGRSAGSTRHALPFRYPQSKWSPAEQLVVAARSRGLPGHNPDVDDDGTQPKRELATDDYIIAGLRGFLELNILPD